MDISSAFKGITTPTPTLHREIHARGWAVAKIAFKDGKYVATVKNPHGQKVDKTGPDEATALAHCLLFIVRQEHIRQSAWNQGWTDKLDPIAEAYAKAPVFDPKAAPAWKELADDSMARFKHLQNHLNINVVDDPEPYASPQEMADDIHKNKNFNVSRANSEHPLWNEDQNVAFRTVHDVMGHAVAGGDFGWHGENLACQAHMPLLSPNAQKALFTECVAQTAAAAKYRGFGPQKVCFLDDHFNPVQQQENAPGHMGTPIDQTVPPVSMPAIEPSTPVGLSKGVPAPWDLEKQGLPQGFINYDTGNPRLPGVGAKRKIAGIPRDINYNYQTGINPGYPNAFLNGYTGPAPEGEDPEGDQIDQFLNTPAPGQGQAPAQPLEKVGPDPLDSKGLAGVAKNLNTGWENSTKDGRPDYQKMKVAVINAFRAVLLSPKKSLKWNAAHYQDVSHISPDEKDPMVYWKTLEKARIDHNRAQGVANPEIAHKPHYKAMDAFRSYYLRIHPGMDPGVAKDNCDRELMHMEADEYDRLYHQGKDMNHDLLEAKVGAAMDTRLNYIMGTKSSMMKDRIEQEEKKYKDRLQRQREKVKKQQLKDRQKGKRASEEADEEDDPDFYDDTEQDVNPAAQKNKPEKYGAFMGAPLYAMAKLSQYADQILEAALEDIKNHDSAGWHFRHTVLSLQIPGVGPKVCSFAWLLLQPLKSQLATMDTHMADVLGHTEKDINNRDYYRMERQLQAGRDASGYGHMPLGMFQWGMWDMKRNGMGVPHQDHTPLACMDPTDWHDHQWEDVVGTEKGEDWHAPAWWEATKPYRDAEAAHWDRDIVPVPTSPVIPAGEMKGLPKGTLPSADFDENDLTTNPDSVPGYMEYPHMAGLGDPLTCSSCRSHNLTEPRQVGHSLYQTCLDCNRTQRVDATNPLVQQQQQAYPQYPQLLQDVAQPRPWITASEDGSTDEIHLALDVPTRIRKVIANWVGTLGLDPMDIEAPGDYHITVAYAEAGMDTIDKLDTIFHRFNLGGMKFTATGVSKLGDSNALVILLESDSYAYWAEEVNTYLEELGVDVNRYDSGWTPHITVAYTTKTVTADPPPLTFRARAMTFSQPREIHGFGFEPILGAIPGNRFMEWPQETKPWTPGVPGKGLIHPHGEVEAWQTDENGWPHHIAHPDGRLATAQFVVHPTGHATVTQYGEFDPEATEENVHGILQDNGFSVGGADAGQYDPFNPETFPADLWQMDTKAAGVTEWEILQKKRDAERAVERAKWQADPIGMERKQWDDVVKDPSEADWQGVEHVPTHAVAPFAEYDRRPGGKDSMADPERWNALRDHIQEHGIQNPIQIHYNPETQAGHIGEGNHRVQIAQELGIPSVPVKVNRSPRSSTTQIPMTLRPRNEWRNYRGDLHVPSVMSPSDFGLPTVPAPTDPDMEQHTGSDVNIDRRVNDPLLHNITVDPMPSYEWMEHSERHIPHEHKADGNGDCIICKVPMSSWGQQSDTVTDSLSNPTPGDMNPGIRAKVAQNASDGLSQPPYDWAKDMFSQTHPSQVIAGWGEGPVMYHVSPSQNHESIMANGLDGAQNPKGGYAWTGDISGQYLFGSQATANQAACRDFIKPHVYAVNVGGLNVESDPRMPDSYVVRDPIGPGRIQWVGRSVHTGEPPYGQTIRAMTPNGSKTAMTPSGVNVMWHVAPRAQRESIEQYGLDASHAPYPTMNSNGYYAHPTLEGAKEYKSVLEQSTPSEYEQGQGYGEPHDLYEIRPAGPASYEDEYEHYFDQPLSPDRIRRIASKTVADYSSKKGYGHADRLASIEWFAESRPKLANNPDDYDWDGHTAAEVSHGDLQPLQMARAAMAADPEWLNDRIKRKGPYVYHYTRSPEDAKKILSKGLLPWDHPRNAESTGYTGDTDFDMWGNPSMDQMAGDPSGAYFEPRLNHVYLGDEDWINNGPGVGHPNVVRVDLRKLDPQRLNPDEDAIADSDARKIWGLDPETPPDPYSEFEDEVKYPTRGDWAGFQGVKQPSQTAWSLDQHGTVAHNGPIPPHAIDYPHDPSYQAELDPDQPWTTVNPRIQDLKWENMSTASAQSPLLPTPSRTDMAIQHTGQIPGDENLSSDIRAVRENPYRGVNPSYLGYAGPNRQRVYIKPQGDYHVNDLAKERAAFVIGHHLGVPVPHTVVQNVETPKGEFPSAVTTAIDGRNLMDYDHSDVQKKWPEQSRRIALLDRVIHNGDRHLGNIVKGEDGNIYPIDHGGSFTVRDPSLGPWSNEELAGSDKTLTPDEIQKLEHVRDNVDTTQMGLTQEDHAGMIDRINHMLGSGTL